MTARESQLITKIRQILADKNDRWTTNALLNLINEAVIDISMKLKMLYNVIEIPISGPVLQLPSDIIDIDSAYIEDEPLALVSHEYLKERNPSYLQEEGKVKAVIYDKRVRTQLRLYPKPDETYIKIVPFGENKYFNPEAVMFQPNVGLIYNLENLTDMLDGFLQFGRGVDETYRIDDLFGMANEFISLNLNTQKVDSVLGELVSDDMKEVFGVTLSEDVDQPFGVVCSIVEESKKLKLVYIKRAEKVDELDLLYDSAIIWYVVGNCLRFDMDSQNVNLGNQYIQMYLGQLKELKKDTSRNSVSTTSLKAFEIEYKGFI